MAFVCRSHEDSLELFSRFFKSWADLNISYEEMDNIISSDKKDSIEK